MVSKQKNEMEKKQEISTGTPEKTGGGRKDGFEN
jgi:hypothetical protein